MKFSSSIFFQHTFFTNDTKSHFLFIRSSLLHLFLLLTLSILSTSDQKQSCKRFLPFEVQSFCFYCFYIFIFFCFFLFFFCHSLLLKSFVFSFIPLLKEKKTKKQTDLFFFIPISFSLVQFSTQQDTTNQRLLFSQNNLIFFY